MEDFYKEILDNDGEPYSKVLNDMGINNGEDRKGFIDVTLMFAQNCYGIATKNEYPKNQRMDGHFNWRTTAPARFFKVHFSYFHSEDLLFAIRGFEELTMEEYVTNLDGDKDSTQIINPSSDLAKNLMNKNEN